MSHEISVAVIVAHPDDETLWAGGTILSHADWNCVVLAMCRARDPDRSVRFLRAMDEFGAQGRMADLDDGPEQSPLPDNDVRDALLSLLPYARFDLVLTHGPRGEYTRHLRHEETSRAVLALWRCGRLSTDALWLFAYEDGRRAHLPRAVTTAHQQFKLDDEIWSRKYRIITDVYGFDADSFEARTTPRVEAFWCFTSPHAVPDGVQTED